MVFLLIDTAIRLPELLTILNKELRPGSQLQLFRQDELNLSLLSR